MNPNDVLSEVGSKLAQATEHLTQELSKIRTGRAHPGMLDGIMVEVYGQMMPLKALASITTPEAQQLQISPFDPTNLQAITDAIRADQSLGLNPADDGRIVRIQIPPLTSETRQDMVKIINQKLEEAMISARNARHEAMKRLDTAEKSKQIGKDEVSRSQKQIDEALANHKTEAEGLAKAKEQEVLTV